MTIAPDITGFVAAASSLRQVTGDSITFSIPQPPQWPAGTRINPDTNEPYDAMVKPTNAPVQVTITASVILKEASPLRPQADTHVTEAGLMSGMDIILDIDATVRAGQTQSDYQQVQNATEFTYAGRRYRIEEWKPFAMGDITYRYLCYGMEH